MKLSKNFSSTEFVCPCCGLGTMDKTFIAKLQAVRDIIGAPIKINSGARCPDHNRAVGGKCLSRHLTEIGGELRETDAADLAVNSDELRFRILEAAMLVKFRGIGIYPTFIHLDLGTKKRCWLKFLKPDR